MGGNFAKMRAQIHNTGKVSKGPCTNAIRIPMTGYNQFVSSPTYSGTNSMPIIDPDHLLWRFVANHGQMSVN